MTPRRSAVHMTAHALCQCWAPPEQGYGGEDVVLPHYPKEEKNI
jgi:hypothetical protein